MSEFHLPGLEDYSLARTWMREERTFPEIRERLESERGLLPESAASVANELAKELIEPLLLGGLRPEIAVQRLVSRGFSEDEASALVDQKRSPRKRARGGRRSSDFGLWCGAFLLLLGFVLAIGNVTGIFPTFSGAGRLCMLLGIAVAGGGSLFRR